MLSCRIRVSIRGVALGSHMAGETAVWMLFICFWAFGRYTAYLFRRSIGKANMPALAVLGLLFSRIGEAAGTLGTWLFAGTPLIVITGTVFVLVTVLFFMLYQRFYTTVATPEELEEKRFAEYSAHFGFSVREQEIFTLIIRGMSNAEIAGTLYITESTVKFHIGNIFKKSGFARRSELITDYKLGNNH